ncbi:MAG: hypothetical protein MJY44_05790 [Bacteroidales bacterium]|nr:hypothetical protein [Bacteroidales bacterium]
MDMDKSKEAVLRTATPKDGYSVTPETTVVLDCIRATRELYDRIESMINSLYGNMAMFTFRPYSEHLNILKDLLQEELCIRVEKNFKKADNKDADNISI